ncbi:hypothetical protein HZA86_04690 [Candidatus Uhrbacteria bacterium]|nr:hypothetical protein [Candidatus Uhrbacteria bacterium]
MKKFLCSIPLVGILLILPFSVGATASRFTSSDFKVELSNITENSIGDLVVDIVDFGTKVAGVAAIVMILWAGLQRITAGGDSGKVEESSEIMWGAIVGLGLALGAVLLLNAINPDLTKTVAIKFPEVTKQQKVDIPKVGITEAEGGTAQDYTSGLTGATSQASPQTQVPPGTPTVGAVSQECKDLIERAGLHFVQPNDARELSSGVITSRFDGRRINVSPYICEVLNATVAAGIPVDVQSIVGGHDSQQVGGAGASPHADTDGNGRGLDIDKPSNGEEARRIAAFYYANRERLHITQIIIDDPALNEFNYNTVNGVGRSGAGAEVWPNGKPPGHRGHFHITVQRR